MGSLLDRLRGKHWDPSADSDPAKAYQAHLLSAEQDEQLHTSRHKQAFTDRLTAAWTPRQRIAYLAYALAHQRDPALGEAAYRLTFHVAQAFEDIEEAFTAAESADLATVLASGQIVPGQYTIGLEGPLKALANTYTPETLPAAFREPLSRARAALLGAPAYNEESRRARLLNYLHNLLNDPSDVQALLGTLPADRLGDRLRETFAALPANRVYAWIQLLRQAENVSGGKPTAKWLARVRPLVAAVGEAALVARANEWLTLVTRLKVDAEEVTYIYPGTQRSMNYTSYRYLNDESLDLVKALIWMLPDDLDPDSAAVVTRLAAKGYEKVPGKGPLAARISNACLYKLSRLPGLEGVAQLSQLRLKIRHATARKAIDNSLDEAAEREGVTVNEIEELAVDDYGMTRGHLVEPFDDFRAELTIVGPGKSTLQWFRGDGKAQKSVPAHVKTGFAERLKALTTAKKELDKSTSAQRDRLDRLLRGDFRWDKAAFAKTYQRHGVLGWFGQDLIWDVYTDDAERPSETITGDRDGGWQTVDRTAYALPEDAHFALWHPAAAATEDVMAWRAHLEGRQVQQPIRQAFREVYLLTPAELNTEIYSNRMAGHLLRQHQYVNLARLRNWRATLLGAWDSPDDDIATLELPGGGLTASFYVRSVEAEGAYNETGIWNYVSTDQVRFARNGQVLNVAEVPPVVFSEVMRDCDLFVGVASVSNDPNWQDRGETPIVQQYGGYWREYSFGDLNELARSRRGILARLVPRLKIRDVATLQGNFLEVQGKLHRYKIHIGSGNILIAPQDKYLCIVPGSADSVGSAADKTFLPFEGDRTLSIILSKAFMLAEDAKITDPTITRQL